MKNSCLFIAVLLTVLSVPGCGNKKSPDKPADTSSDIQAVADTGFTGIRQYYSKKTLTYEVTFKNGVRQGLMRSFYPGGKLRQTFWYEKGLKEDTAVWFYEEGPVFRKTPFRKDSMNGTQIQYYKSGAIRAKLSFVNGIRTPYLEEFTSNGVKITDYPAVIVKTTDSYSRNGTFDIYLGLNIKNVKVNFYKGELTNGLFNPKSLKKINTTDFNGHLHLSKSAEPGTASVGIISEITTSLGNKLIVHNNVPLPYNNLR